MKKVLLLLFLPSLMLLCSNSMASPGFGDANSLLFLRNHVSMETGFTVLRVKPLTEFGQGNMTLSHKPGMYLGFKYHINVNNYFSIRFGQVMGLHAFRYDFDPGNNDTVSFEPVKLSVVKPYMAIPIELCARVLVQQRNVFGVMAGVSASIYATEKLNASTSLAGNPQGQEVYQLKLAYQKPNPFINLVAGLEYSRALRSMDLVTFSLKYSLGFRPLFNASYEHSDNDLVLSSGSFTSYNDYISLSIGYVFTRVNKLVDK